MTGRWREVRLGDVATVVRGVTYKKEQASPHPQDATLPLLRATNFESSIDLDGQLVHVPQTVVKPEQRLQRGDILVATSSGSISVVGKSARLTTDWEGTFGAFCAVVRVGRDVDSRYLNLCIKTEGVRRRWSAAAQGTNINNLKRSDLESTPVPLPPLAEQERIVGILEDHLSRLDAATAYLDASARRLEVMISSVLTSLIPDVAEYPNTWRHATVAEAGTVGLGRQRHPDWHNGPQMKPYLRVANVFEDRIDTSDVMDMHWPDETFERFRLHIGDVLLNEGQTPELLGRPAMYRGEPPDVAFTNSLLRFQAGPAVLPEFALLVFRRHMRAGRFKREARITTNIAHLSASRLKPIEFPIPPLAIQKIIVDEAHERLDAIGRLRNELASTQERQERLRRALLTAAFAGQLTSPLDRRRM